MVSYLEALIEDNSTHRGTLTITCRDEQTFSTCSAAGAFRFPLGSMCQRKGLIETLLLLVEVGCFGDEAREMTVDYAHLYIK